MEKIVIHTICKQPVTTMMEYPCELYKNYKIKKTPFRNQIYNDDTKWIAYWYYSTYQQENNVEFEIIGDFHNTQGYTIEGIKNPDHLSIKIKNSNIFNNNQILHLMRDINGFGFLHQMQNATFYGGKKQKSKKKKILNFNKNKKKNKNKTRTKV